MRTKLLLLDFDGTLANTGRANATSYIEALAEEGITISMDEYRTKYFGLRCPEFLADIGITDPAQMKRIRQRKVDIYPTHFDMVTLNRPLWDFVQQFRAQGGKAMIVSTGHIDNITNVMRYLGIENQLDGVLSSDDVVVSKPAPDCFLKAMEIAGVTPAETIIFEDSEIGLAAAEATGAAYFKVELEF
ncbi:MAG: HAD family phosphatase [Rikenellaceae bacterium]|nr:HAD family phosphatase [Rikenellaceae bacterium]